MGFLTLPEQSRPLGKARMRLLNTIHEKPSNLHAKHYVFSRAEPAVLHVLESSVSLTNNPRISQLFAKNLKN